MITRNHRRFASAVTVLSAGSLFFCQTSLHAQFIVPHQQSFPVGAAVPDNDDLGLLNVGTVSGSGITKIGDVNVWLEISGGYNGDLYVTLAHQGGYAVLLNRVGRRSGDGYGYTDAGFDGTFCLDDQAANGDVHPYRLTLKGDHNMPLNGAVGGAWRPDGRAVPPFEVTDTIPRTATLSGFNNLTADGTWTIYFADLAATGQSTVVSWGLEIVPVPEPAELALAFGLGLLGWAARGRAKNLRPVG
jgi:subtilisin-like proprotein convertase family protein